MRNVWESVVAQEYERMLPKVPGACRCASCKEDVLVYTLNRLPPRYVATVTGGVLSEVKVEEDQGRADIAVALMEAFRVVADSPRHERKARGTK